MSNPQNIDEMLIDYLDGTLAPADREKIEQSLAADAALRQTVADLRAVHDALGRLPVEKLPIQARQIIQEEILAPRSLPMSFARHWLAVAACLLLAVTAGLVIYEQLPSQSPRSIASNEQLAPSAFAPPMEKASADETRMSMKETAAAPAAGERGKIVPAPAPVPLADAQSTPTPAVAPAPLPPVASVPAAPAAMRAAKTEFKSKGDAAKMAKAAPKPAAEQVGAERMQVAKDGFNAPNGPASVAGAASANAQAVLVLRTSDFAAARQQVDRVLSLNNVSYRFADADIAQQTERDDQRMRPNALADEVQGNVRSRLASNSGQSLVIPNLTAEQFENVRVGLNSAANQASDQVVEKQLPPQTQLNSQRRVAENAGAVQSRNQIDQLYQRNYGAQQMAQNAVQQQAPAASNALGNSAVGNIDLVIEFEPMPLPSKASKATLPAATQK